METTKIKSQPVRRACPRIDDTMHVRKVPPEIKKRFRLYAAKVDRHMDDIIIEFMDKVSLDV